MAILGIASESETILAVGLAVTDSTTSGRNDSNFTRSGAVQGSDEADYMTLPNEFEPQNDVWFHAHTWTGSPTASRSFAVFKVGSTPVARIFSGTALSGWPLQTWNGASWTTVATLPHAEIIATGALDFHLKAETEGLIEVFKNEVSLASVAGDYSALAGITNVEFRSAGTGGNATYWSQIIVADETTVGWRLAINPPSGNGAVNEWTGTFADIDEIAPSTSDLIVADAVNETILVSRAARTIPTQFSVAALVVSSYARKSDASVPQDMQAAVRVGGVNYFGGNEGLSVGFAPHETIFATDPATGVAWTREVAGAAATQFGFKAVA